MYIRLCFTGAASADTGAGNGASEIGIGLDPGIFARIGFQIPWILRTISFYLRRAIAGLQACASGKVLVLEGWFVGCVPVSDLFKIDNLDEDKFNLSLSQSEKHYRIFHSNL